MRRTDRSIALKVLCLPVAALMATVGLTAATPAFAAGAGAGAGAGHPTSGLYVSTHGSPANAGGNCGQATFSRIADAVAAAPAGGTVVVCPGTYTEDVLVQKALTLIGQSATIDATGLENAIHVVASGVSVSGFTLANANGEGLLAGIDTPADFGLLPEGSPVLSGITIDSVRALHNDQGFNGSENGNCAYPGDCGGGVHFNVVESSTIRNSQVSNGADGILLTDDYGPNDHNVVEGNLVSNNTTECGIVLPSHNSGAVNYVQNQDGSLTVTGTNPSAGGVYDNQVLNNVAINNGTATAPPQFGGGGSGSGIGIFGSGPGTGAYDNLVKGNYMAGNGLAGFTIHAHHPGGEVVDGNDVIGNSFGTNNLGGDGFDGGVSDFQTTAIAVYSVPAVAMTISGNAIRNNAIGIWLTDTVSANGLETNHYANVGTSVVVQPAN